MPEYIDAHSHIHDQEFYKDIDDVLLRMKDKNVWTICVGTHNISSKSAVEMAEGNEGIFATIGIHPTDKIGEGMNLALFEELVKSPKVVGIGECGLDFFRGKGDDPNEIKRQKGLFEKQIQFALEKNLPLMIHSRNAYKETLEILKIYSTDPKLRGDIHFFAGTIDDAREFLDLGFTLSFTGVITFARDYDEVIKYIPLDSILSETDAPFVTPVPFRGKTNEPAYVDLVVEKISEIKNASLDIVKTQLVENAIKRFSLKP